MCLDVAAGLEPDAAAQMQILGCMGAKLSKCLIKIGNGFLKITFLIPGKTLIYILSDA